MRASFASGELTSSLSLVRGTGGNSVGGGGGGVARRSRREWLDFLVDGRDPNDYQPFNLEQVMTDMGPSVFQRKVYQNALLWFRNRSPINTSN